MRSPILIQGMAIRPIVVGSGTPFCMVCMKREAKWAIGIDPNDYVSCAECFLYDSPWGKEHAFEIAELVDEVGREMGIPISANGKVIDDHGDRILAAIVLTSNVAMARVSNR